MCEEEPSRGSESTIVLHIHNKNGETGSATEQKKRRSEIFIETSLVFLDFYVICKQ